MFWSTVLISVIDNQLLYISCEYKKIYLRSFGCQMNDYDSARIIDLMREHGYKRSAQPEDADLLVVVTCAIREKKKLRKRPSLIWAD